MFLPKMKRERDPAYLKSYEGNSCFVCQSTEGVCGCHIRKGNIAGMGLKSSDKYTIPMCRTCHASQHATNETAFWKSHGFTIKQINAVAVARYSLWKKDKK